MRCARRHITVCAALLIAAHRASDAKFYYDQVQRLWGEGWSAGRYRFATDGSLIAAWSGCATR